MFSQSVIMEALLCLVLFLAVTGHSNAAYCICKDGATEQVLQKNIDYACGAGADCTPILQNGPCYQPNTVKAHCDYAVNSYFQKRGQTQGSCDFMGTATLSNSAPYASGSCAYPTSPGGTGTGTNTPTIGTTPTVGTTPYTGTTTPTTGTTTPTMGAPSSIFNTGTGLGPTGSGTGMDNTGDAQALYKDTNIVISVALAFCVSLLALTWS